MKRKLLFLCFSVLANYGYSQIGFVEDTSNSFVQTFFGDSAFTDYDSDGDYDLLITGHIDNITIVTKLYNNNGSGVFTEVSTNILPARFNVLEFTDIDNDGDDDLITFGSTNGGYQTDIYSNNAGVYNLLPSNPFPVLELGDISTADINGDNKIDILLTGQVYNGTNNTFTELYDNNGSVITNTIIDVRESSSDFGDIDNDGDLDLIITGYDNIKLYKNDGNGVFTEQTGAPTFSNRIVKGDIKFSDVDGDSDLDIIATSNSVNPKLYLNDGLGNYTASAAPFDSYDNAKLIAYDFDNDNDQDVFVTGNPNKLYINDGSGTFSDSGLSFGITYGPSVGLTIADVNNDGKMDIFLSGSDGSGPQCKLYLNTSTLSTQGFENSSFGIYPNPATTTFKIVNKNSNQVENVSIFDIQGKLVKSFQDTFEIFDINELKSGIYLVKIKTDSGIISTNKLIKQ